MFYLKVGKVRHSEAHTEHYVYYIGLPGCFQNVHKMA